MFFFNYKRVNAAICNPDFSQNIGAMFGKARAEGLPLQLEKLTPANRKRRVHEAMEESLHEAGVNFVHRFDFAEREDSLFFLSQNEKGLRTMKRIMAGRSRKDAEGIPTYSYQREPSPLEQQRTLWTPPSALEELRDDLLKVFQGQTVTFEDLFRGHHPGKRFVEENYRTVLEQMAERDEVEITSPKARRPGTFGPHVQIAFRRRKG